MPGSDDTTTAPTGTLDGWACAPFTGGGYTHDVYRRGDGPGVVLIPEIPGITDEVLGFADHLVDNGFSVAVPSLFGDPGRPMSGRYIASVAPRLCVASEFRAFAHAAHRPVTDYLRALAADLAASTPGPGVGVIGMCFTGGFALAAAIDDSVAAAVLSQPGIPFPVSRARRVDPGMSPDEFTRVAERAARGDVCAIGLRFSEDRVVPPERFQTIKNRLGDAFEVIQLDSSAGNPDGYPAGAHSVLTHEVRVDPPNSASRARDRVVEFLGERLRPAE